MLVPIVEMLDIGLIFFGEFLGKRPSQVYVNSDCIIERT